MDLISALTLRPGTWPQLSLTMACSRSHNPATMEGNNGWLGGTWLSVLLFFCRKSHVKYVKSLLLPAQHQVHNCNLQLDPRLLMNFGLLLGAAGGPTRGVWVNQGPARQQQRPMRPMTRDPHGGRWTNGVEKCCNGTQNTDDEDGWSAFWDLCFDGTEGANVFAICDLVWIPLKTMS